MRKGVSERVSYHKMAEFEAATESGPADENFGDMFDLFAQAGGAYQTPGALSYGNGGNINANYPISNATSAGWQVLLGGGFDINLTKSVAFNVTDLYYFGSNNALGNSNALLAGMKFAF